MKFTINNDEWQIEEKSKDELKELYEKETQEKTYFVFGVTIKSAHIIYINKDMCEEQKIKTLKHELTHCYNVMDINEEVICDIVASSNDFINVIVEQYKREKVKSMNVDVDEINQTLLCNKEGEKSNVKRFSDYFNNNT